MIPLIGSNTNIDEMQYKVELKYLHTTTVSNVIQGYGTKQGLGHDYMQSFLDISYWKSLVRCGIRITDHPVNLYIAKPITKYRINALNRSAIGVHQPLIVRSSGPAG